MKWIPRRYQTRAIKWVLERGAAALFMRPGLGKTSVTLAAFDILRRKGLSKRMLVIAPLRVCYEVWPQETSGWDDFAHLRLEVLHGPYKDAALKRDADIYVINPEGLEWLTSENRLKALNADILVVDESTKFKHTRTRRFKAIKPILKKFKRRYILTGTPAPNGLMDLFGQVYVLDQGAALGQYITHYRMMYFEPVGPFDWVPKSGAAAQIQQRISHLALYLGDDELDLPELVENVVWVDLPPKARKIYDELEKELFSELEDGRKLIAISNGVAANKCRQVCNGGVYYEGEQKRESIQLHTAKLEAVQDLVDELMGQPVLIVYEYLHDLERLQKAFPGAPYLGGGLRPSVVSNICAQWNAGELPILLGQPQSMGHGLNLQGGGNTVIWAGLTWDLELDDQTVKRIHRQGSAHSRVFVHRVAARRTIDEVVLRALSFKSRTQASLLEAFKHYAKQNKK